MSAPQTLTTNMPNGLTNADKTQTMGNAGIPDPSWAHVYHNDFDTYAAGDWTATVTGSGTQALTPADGGQLLLTTTTGAADAVYMQLKAAGFALAANKDTFFKFSGTLSDVVNDVFYCGLMNTTTTPNSPTDGVYIVKATGVATLSIVSVVSSVSTTVAFPSNLVLANATAFEVGFHVDYLGNVEAFFNPGTGAQFGQLSPVSSSAGAQAGRGRVALIAAPTLTTAVLNPSFGILNSSGVARTLAADYVTVVRQR